MAIPGFTASAAIEVKRPDFLTRNPPSKVAFQQSGGVTPAAPCCESCEPVCDYWGWNSRNCRACTRHCVWCNI